MVKTVTYSGQDVAGWDKIGTQDLSFDITEDIDIDSVVDELKRCCGKQCEILLWKMNSADDR